MKQKILMIKIDRIRVPNPRVRDKHKFAKVVDSIRKVGLKKPIQVTLRKGSPKNAPTYDLICGQGRMEAFQALGLKEIPAMILKVTREEAMLMSLIENMARRHASPLELIDEIVRLKACNHSNAAIGRKLGISGAMVQNLLTLKNAGESRLIYEVINGSIPLGVAIEIAKFESTDQQKAFLEAYEKKELTHASLRAIRRVIRQRDAFGKKLSSSPKNPSRSAEGLVNTLKKETQRQKLLIKKASVCEARLLFVVQAMRRLCDDEDFVTLLRAEKLNTMPKELSTMMENPTT